MEESPISAGCSSWTGKVGCISRYRDCLQHVRRDIRTSGVGGLHDGGYLCSERVEIYWSEVLSESMAILMRFTPASSRRFVCESASWDEIPASLAMLRETLVWPAGIGAPACRPRCVYR